MPRDKRKVQLINPQGDVERTFANRSEAVEYCTENLICNSGWISVGLRLGIPFYSFPKSFAFNRGDKTYTGFGYRVVWVDDNEIMEVMEDDNNSDEN